MTCQPVAGTSWGASPEHPALADRHTVDLWLIGLHQPPDCVRELAQALSDDENQRAGRFFTAELADRYRIGRGALRWILARYTGQAAADLRFVTGSQGKPALLDLPLNFNVAHHDTLALIAVSQHAVGVDIENAHTFPDMDRVAEHHFSALELADYYADADRVGVFYRCWTRKEAIIKADSRGLTIPLADFAVSLRENEPPHIRYVTPALRAIAGWSLADVTLPAGSVGALAYTAQLDQVRCYAFAL